MITVTGSVETKLSAAEAFAFMKEFENTSTWDPNTPVMDKLTQGPVAVGHRYHAESEFRGKRRAWSTRSSSSRKTTSSSAVRTSR